MALYLVEYSTVTYTCDKHLHPNIGLLFMWFGVPVVDSSTGDNLLPVAG